MRTSIIFILPMLLLSSLTAAQTDIVTERTPANVFIVYRSQIDVDHQALMEVARGVRHSWPDGRRVRMVLPGKASPGYEVVADTVYGGTGRFMTRFWLGLVFGGQALAPDFIQSQSEVMEALAGSDTTVAVLTEADLGAQIPEGFAVVAF
jgi:hypothetical protein